MRLSRVLTVLVTTLLLTSTLVACGSDGNVERSGGDATEQPSGGGTAPAGQGEGPEGNVDDAPADSPKDDRFTYQPDVVFIGGAESSVLAAGSDGVHYTFDGDAPGVDALQVGSVLYASPTLAGRVAELDDDGGDVNVLLAPVDLTDIFYDAEFHVDDTISADDLEFQAVPDFPDAFVEPGPETEPVPFAEETPVPDAPSTDIPADDGVGKLHGRAKSIPDDIEVIRLPKITLATKGLAQPPGTLPAKEKRQIAVTKGNWKVTPYNAPDKIGLEIERNIEDELKVSIDFAIKKKDLRVVTDTVIKAGVMNARDVLIHGLDGILVDLAAGSAIGAAGNKSFKIEVPVFELKGQIPGEPLVYSTQMNASVTTAIGGNNSTIGANGEWKLNGPLGIQDGEVTAPTLEVVKSIVDSIGGITLAPSGVVFGVSVKFQLGIGLPMMFAGPFTKFAVDVGIVNGSSLGAALARCRQGSLDLWVGAGAGVSISSAITEELTKIFGKDLKVTIEAQKMVNVFHRTVLVPEVALCQGG